MAPAGHRTKALEGAVEHLRPQVHWSPAASCPHRLLAPVRTIEDLSRPLHHNRERRPGDARDLRRFPHRRGGAQLYGGDEERLSGAEAIVSGGQALAAMAKQKIEEVLVELGRVVITWNGLEHSLAMLLRTLTRSGPIVDVLASQMRDEGLCRALKVLSNGTGPEIATRIEHAVTAFERLQEWRNYYVHRPVGGFGVPEGDGEAWIGTFKVTAKRKLTVSRGAVKATDMRAFVAHGTLLGNYIGRLNAYLEAGDRDDVFLWDGTTASLPEVPLLPPTLQEHLKGVDQV